MPDFPELDELLGDLPDLPSLDFTFPELDAGLPDLPGLGFDLEALDKLLDLEPGKGRSFCGPLKNARARDMGYSGEGARKSKQICGAKTRTGKPCQAHGNGAGASCMAAKAPGRRRKRARRAHSLLCGETTAD